MPGSSGSVPLVSMGALEGEAVLTASFFILWPPLYCVVLLEQRVRIIALLINGERVSRLSSP